MMKKILRVFLILVMVAGVSLSIANFLAKDSKAAMTSEQLYFYEIDGGYAYLCDGDGEGCYTVTPDPSPK